MKQTTYDRIFNSKHSNSSRVTSHTIKDFRESTATMKLQLLPFEIFMSSYIMKTSDLSLYCYSFHICISISVSKVYNGKRSYSLLSGTVSISISIYDFHKLKSTRNFPLYNPLQSKNKSNGKMCKM